MEKTIGKNGLKISDKETITGILAEVNGKARSFTADFDDVLSAVKKAETQLDNANLADSYRTGATAVFKTSGPSANSYKYGAAGTKVTFRRFKDGWRVMEIERITVYPRSSGGVKVTLSAAQAEAVSRATLAPFEIKKAA